MLMGLKTNTRKREQQAVYAVTIETFKLHMFYKTVDI